MRPGDTTRWGITALATMLSTYALDGIATAAGVLLVASGLLAGLDRTAVLIFAAGSYLVWALGLRAALAANWSLLSATGTSTNLLSKAAHDLTARRTANRRACRFAASTGYLGTEAAKEVPYYVAAFGTTMLGDSISANEAIIFLGGTNLGAALYESGLAIATKTVLRRTDPQIESDRRSLADVDRGTQRQLARKLADDGIGHPQAAMADVVSEAVRCVGPVQPQLARATGEAFQAGGEGGQSESVRPVSPLRIGRFNQFGQVIRPLRGGGGDLADADRVPGDSPTRVHDVQLMPGHRDDQPILSCGELHVAASDPPRGPVGPRG
jgi:hypothetical protein